MTNPTSIVVPSSPGNSPGITSVQPSTQPSVSGWRGHVAMRFAPMAFDS